MEHLGSLLSAVLTITTIIGIGAAGMQRARMQNLKEHNDELRDHRDDDEKEMARLKNEATTLRADLEALGRMVRNDAVVIALGDQIAELAKQQQAASEMQTDLGREILAAIRDISGGAT